MKGVYIFLANGFEDIEALATRDILKRGNIDVETVGVSRGRDVISARGITVLADMTLDELLNKESGGACSSKDFLIFPGGMPGSKNLGACSELIDLMNRHYSEGGSVAAICAAPEFVLGQLDGIETATFTCYDGDEAPLIAKGATFVRKPAVTSGRIITGRGPGHSIEFGLEILKMLTDEDTVTGIAAAVTLPCD